MKVLVHKVIEGPGLTDDGVYCCIVLAQDEGSTELYTDAIYAEEDYVDDLYEIVRWCASRAEPWTIDLGDEDDSGTEGAPIAGYIDG